MHRGYVALWRKFQDHPFWKERRVFSKAEAWIDILWCVQHEKKPKEVILGMEVLIQNYGETLKSINTWALRWRWSESKVRRFFKLLKKLNQIDLKSEGITTRLSVINYAIYDPKRRTSGEGATRERRGSDDKETLKNDNNNKKLTNTSAPRSDSPLKNSKIGKPIPNDFSVTNEMIKWFSTQRFKNIKIETATEQFIDYWRSVPGVKGLKSDWVATWRNGMRNKEKWIGRDLKNDNPSLSSKIMEMDFE